MALTVEMANIAETNQKFGREIATLSITNLSKSFGGVKALDDINIQIPKRSISAIVGPNGSGKTTLLNVISGFLKPDKGQRKIVFNGINIVTLAPYKISKKGIGRTFQIIRVFPQLSVMENILAALEDAKKEGLFYGLNPFSKYSSKTLEKKAIELLSEIELQNKVDELAGNLSHGQRRLLEIMRTRALDAELYLFDEPTAGVFPEIRERIIRLFKGWQKKGKTIIFVEHDMETVREAADRVIVLDKGKIISDGDPAVVLEEKVVIDAYFGGVGD